jgi:hypothetical protein
MRQRFTDPRRSANDDCGAAYLRRHFHTDGLPNNSGDLV